MVAQPKNLKKRGERIMGQATITIGFRVIVVFQDTGRAIPYDLDEIKAGTTIHEIIELLATDREEIWELPDYDYRVEVNGEKAYEMTPVTPGTKLVKIYTRLPDKLPW